jgi:hypothetical protein
VPHDGVARRAFTATAAAPLVRFDDPAREDSTVGFQTLPDGFEAELVEPAERGQVKASGGSVKHVEVSRMGSVRTSILGRPRPLPPDRLANPRYTLNCDEPVIDLADAPWNPKFVEYR